VARKKFTTSLDEEVIKQLKLQAVKENTNASKIIERLVKEYLKKMSDLQED
jgi:metal-responsive CopG/Arc/MetJ family transcriptional regulator